LPARSAPDSPSPRTKKAAAKSPLEPAAEGIPAQCGYCTHKIFGRGKIVQVLPPDKYRVNFPGFGLKVILAAYLHLESAAPEA
jgi:DNA helicase-2/ATP-dependent DNA helicase PcrA